jgi:hypothetical protein
LDAEYADAKKNSELEKTYLNNLKLSQEKNKQVDTRKNFKQQYVNNLANNHNIV